MWLVPGGDEGAAFPGAPVYAIPDHGYLTILLERGGQFIYRHPHLSVEVIAAGLPSWLDRFAPGHPEVASFALRADAEPLLERGPVVPELVASPSQP